MTRPLHEAADDSRRSFLNGRVTSPVNIYALCESSSGVVRYVGKTVHTPARRLTYHIQQAKHSSHRPVCRWLLKRLKAGLRPVVTTIEVVPADNDWAVRERYWIEHFRNASPSRLLNLTEGGEGLAGHRYAGTEHARKIGDTLRRGSHFACEQCGDDFFRKPRDIRNGDCRFCSRACYSAWQVGKSKPIPVEVHAKGVAAAAAKRRALQYCIKGHEFSPENTRLNSGGSRVCRACSKGHKRRYLEAQRA